MLSLRRHIFFSVLSKFCSRFLYELFQNFFFILQRLKTRKRRQMFNLAVLMKEAADTYPVIEKEELCSGGKGAITGTDLADCKYVQRKVWKVKCKEYTVSCYWIRVCPSFDDCYKNHLINRSFCCEYICV